MNIDTAKSLYLETANDYDINELPVGLETVAFWTVKTCDLNAFINLSGDKNPLHIDEDYAIQNGFDYCSSRVSYLRKNIWFNWNGIAGQKVPFGEELEFPNPVYVNDHVEIRADKEKHHD